MGGKKIKYPASNLVAVMRLLKRNAGSCSTLFAYFFFADVYKRIGVGGGEFRMSLYPKNLFAYGKGSVLAKI